MNMGRDAVPAVNKINTVNNQDRPNSDFLSSKIKPEIPDLTFLSKGQLRQMIEDLCMEIAKMKYERENRSDPLIVQERDYFKNKSDKLQKKLLALQAMYINEFRKEVETKAFMVAV